MTRWARNGVFSLTGAGRYAAVAVVFLAGFYGLIWAAHLVPEKQSAAFVKQAFDAGVLHTRNDYGWYSSLRGLAGRDRFSDCRSLLLVVRPPAADLDQVLAPLRWHERVKGKGKTTRCGWLRRAAKGEEGTTAALKVRYWHGSMAITAAWMHISSELSLMQIMETTKAAAYFAWGLLALLAFAHSRRLFAVLAPVVVAGIFASGISYGGSFSHGFPYVFAILALAGLVRLLTAGASPSRIRLYFFAVGMVSAFLYLLDGHQILLVPLSLVILYFAREDAGLRGWAALAAGCLALFALGFGLSYLVNLGAKVAILGWHLVPDFFEQLAGRMKGAAYGEARTVMETIGRLFDPGYVRMGFLGHPGFFQTFLSVSLIAALAGVGIAGYRCWRTGRAAPAAGVVVIAVAAALVFVRVGILPNHSWIHYQFIGRYMFVPLALAISVLVAAWGCHRPGLPHAHPGSGR